MNFAKSLLILLGLAMTCASARPPCFPEFVCEPGTIHIYVYLLYWFPCPMGCQAQTVARHDGQLVEFGPGGGGTYANFDELRSRFMQDNKPYFDARHGDYTVTIVRDALTDARMPPRTQALLRVQKRFGDRAAREFIRERWKADLLSSDPLIKRNAQIRLRGDDGAPSPYPIGDNAPARSAR